MKIGIIGCGGVSTAHINSYLGLCLEKDVIHQAKNDVIAIADLLESKVDRVYEHYKQKGYSIKHRFSGDNAYKQVLGLDLDAVSITVPPIPDKVRIIKAALKSNKHTLVEKPLSYDVETAKELAEVQKGNLTFAVCYNWRHTFIMETLKEIIQAKRYGELHHISVVHVEPWNYTNPDSFYTRLGYVLEHNIHDINYLRFLNGEIKDVAAVAYGRLPRNPSSLTVDFNYENRVAGTFNSMNGTRTAAFNIRCAFDKGSVLGFLSKNNPDFEWQDIPYFRIFTPDGELFAEPVLSLRQDDLKANKISWVRVAKQGASLSHQEIIEDFLDSIRQNRPPKSTALDGYRDVSVAYAILKSIEDNKQIILT